MDDNDEVIGAINELKRSVDFMEKSQRSFQDRLLERLEAIESELNQNIYGAIWSSRDEGLRHLQNIENHLSAIASYYQRRVVDDDPMSA